MNPPADFSLRRIFHAAYTPSILFGIGEGAILPVVPLTARDLGASVAQAALVVTLIGVGAMASNLPASHITMRWGERPALVAAALWAALGMGLCLSTGALWVFALGCVMVGMSQAVYNLARQSWLTAAVPLAWRAQALSTLGGVMRIGLFIGPILAAAAIHAFGTTAAYVVGIAAMLVGAAVCRTIPDLETLHGTSNSASAAAAPPAPRTPKVSTTAMLREHRSVFIRIGLGVVLISAVRAARQVVLPLWAAHIGLAASTTSLIYGLSAAIDMLVFYPAGRVMDRRGRLWVIVPSMLIMGLSLLAMPLTQGTASLLAVALAIGFGNGIGSGMVMTLGADYSPVPGRPVFLGLWRLLSDLGATGGPGLVSMATAALSLPAGIALAGLLAFAAAAQLAWWLPRTRPVHQTIVHAAAPAPQPPQR